MNFTAIRAESQTFVDSHDFCDMNSVATNCLCGTYFKLTITFRTEGKFSRHAVAVEDATVVRHDLAVG
ncbi:hypothetical protein Poly59_26390 [Rubripirellula reticaptiva]|uniref:Uncharacterized protein n=1 Tax=Rubripirellula reticaptiva TaxID=2528013 RepID=A0A5C6F550_9BACT|nr:hypothetical protein Poly59_26390 [Rubripirellula reticaptiva]